MRFAYPEQFDRRFSHREHGRRRFIPVDTTFTYASFQESEGTLARFDRRKPVLYEQPRGGVKPRPKSAIRTGKKTLTGESALRGRRCFDEPERATFYYYRCVATRNMGGHRPWHRGMGSRDPLDRLRWRRPPTKSLTGGLSGMSNAPTCVAPETFRTRMAAISLSNSSRSVTWLLTRVIA